MGGFMSEPSGSSLVSVRVYVRILIAVVSVLFLTAFGFFYWLWEGLHQRETEAADFHLTAITSLDRARVEVAEIEKALLARAPGRLAPIGSQPMISLQIVEASLETLQELYVEYSPSVSRVPLDRAHKDVATLREFSQDRRWLADEYLPRSRVLLESVGIAVEQMDRLHMEAFRETAKNIAESKREAIQMYLAGLAVLGLLGGGVLLQLLARIRQAVAREVQIETALQASRGRFQGILDAASDVIISIDERQKIILFNKQAEAVFGYPAEEVLGEPLEMLLPPRFRGKHGDYVRGFAAESASQRWMGQTMSLCGLRRNGQEFPIDVSLSSLKLEGTQVLTAILRDVTERHRAERALGESQQLFETLASSAPVGIFRTDAQGGCVYVNERWTTIAGLSPEEAMGDGWARAIHPKDRDWVVDQWHITADGGPPLRSEYRFRRPDGTVTWVLGQAVPEKDLEGEITGYVGTITDISTRKQTERALRDRARQQAAVAELGRQALVGVGLQELLDTAVQVVAETLGVEFCKVLELVPDGKSVLLRAGVGWKEGLVGRALVRTGLESQAGYTLLSEVPVIVEELKSEKRFSGPPLLHDHQVVSGMSVIIQGQNGPYGVMGAHTIRKHRFSQDDVNFLQAVANVLADAIEHKRAEEELLRFSAELEARVTDRTKAVRESEEKLRKFNEELESMILARTEQLQISEARFRGVFEQAGIGIALGDLKGRLIDSNPALQDMLGYNGEELRGMRFSEVTHPEDREADLELFRELTAGERTTFQMEKRYIRKDGQIIWGRVTATAVRGPDEQPQFTMGLVENIDERKRAEQAYWTSERRFHTLAAMAPVGIYRLDAQGRCVYVNEKWSEITGFSAEHALGDAWQQCVHPDDREWVLAQRTKDFQEGRPLQVEYRYLRPDGSIRWAYSQAVHELDKSGNIIGHVGTITDITERKLAEEKIKSSLREKELLLKEVHHRVKNNLQIITSLLSLQSRSVDDGEARDLLLESQTRVGSIALVHEKLYETKDLAGIDFGEYCESLGGSLFQSYGVDPAHIALKVSVEDGFLELDRAIPYGLIVSELVTNSLKYAFPTQARGEIHIAMARPKNGKRILRVADNGVGLPGDFDLHGTKSLGLHLVRTLSEQLGGTLEVDGKNGTEIRIICDTNKKEAEESIDGQRTHIGSGR